jgi:hypothetical protein
MTRSWLTGVKWTNDSRMVALTSLISKIVYVNSPIFFITVKFYINCGRVKYC